ncbi:MAG TPA: GNAT family N-acetyltransferase [Gaiella sp.]|nr:GNAT family N-acetyltransferase [Gaiella sp.]
MTVITDRPQIDTVSTLDGFASLDGEWDALVRAMPRPSPFLLYGWLTSWWRAYGDDGTLAIPIARREGRLVAALPLHVHSHLALSVGSFLGGAHSALADLLLDPTEPTELAGVLARSVAGSGLVDYVDVYGLPKASRLAEALGPDLEVIERVESPVLELGDSWEDVYRAKTSSKTRNLHRRRRRQLAELGTLEMHVAREPEDLEPALEEAFRVHDLRWEGRPDGSGFTTPRGKTFQREAILALAELDVPRIVVLRLDGRAIAFHYYLALAGTMYVHRLGFDPAFARYSPGLINTLDTIETASAEGLARVEFLGGAERYKVELADRFDPLCHGLGLAKGPLAHVAVEARLASIRLRLELKRHARLRRLYVDGVAPVRRLAVRARDAVRA